ncbi:MAG: hypothetical protein PHC75_09985 [Burkholderiales bacterium]|nr:hypothetical protein [Burkholderiales bacterium]
MGTSFEEIYALNNIIHTDSRLTSKPTNLVYQLFYQYLCFAISMFESDCYHDLSALTPFSQSENIYTGSGTSGDFILTDEISSGANVYISVDDVSEGYSYTYTSSTKTVTITPTPILGSEVYIVPYIIGSFTDTLTFQEIDILASGMLIPYQQEHVNTHSLLQQSISTGDYKKTSQAEHIKQLRDLLDDQLAITESKINKYSFKKNPDSMLGLGGGLT